METYQGSANINYTAKNFMHRLIANYSRNFVVLLLCNYLFLKGFATSAIGLSQLPFFKNTLKVNETTYQIFVLIAWLPWSIKAFIGSVSDLYPLFGYHKKWYILLSSATGSVALLLLGFLHFNTGNQLLVPFLMFIVMMQVSVIDLLCEGTYAKEMRSKSKSHGGDAVSFVWACVVTGSFIASTFVGVFTDYFNPQYIYLICFPFSIQVILPVMNNYLGEVIVPKAQRRINFDKLKKNIKIFSLAFLMAIFALGMAFVNLFAGRNIVLLYAVSVSMLLCLVALFTQDTPKAKCNIYLFLMEATYIQIPGAMDYWYTADSTCVAGGPNFDMTYYLTYTNMIGAIAGIAGIFIFQTKMSKWPFRYAFLVSSIIRIFASLFDIFIVLRLNVRLGIPDKVAYLFGDALIMNTASMLASMPAVILTARIVSEGLESTTYAILAGFQNFGQNVSKSVGVAMMGYFSINADIRPCNFQRLPALIFVCHFMLPFVPILIAHWMVDERALSAPVGEIKVYSPVSSEENSTVDINENVIIVSSASES